MTSTAKTSLKRCRSAFSQLHSPTFYVVLELGQVTCLTFFGDTAHSTGIMPWALRPWKKAVNAHRTSLSDVVIRMHLQGSAERTAYSCLHRAGKVIPLCGIFRQHERSSQTPPVHYAILTETTLLSKTVLSPGREGGEVMRPFDRQGNCCK